MYTHVNKCKNNKIKGKNEALREGFRSARDRYQSRAF
jgi:hypothetical protein